MALKRPLYYNPKEIDEEYKEIWNRKLTVLAGALTPMANVSVENNT